MLFLKKNVDPLEGAKGGMIMASKCILCGELLGCKKGKTEYECKNCRLVDDCSIRHYFTTTHLNYKVCRSCRTDLIVQERGFAEKQIRVDI